MDNRFIGSDFSLYLTNERLDLKDATKVFIHYNTALEFISEQYRDDRELLLMRIISNYNYHNNYSISTREVISLDMKYYNYKGKLIPIIKCNDVNKGFILFMDKNNKIIAYIEDYNKKY